MLQIDADAVRWREGQAPEASRTCSSSCTASARTRATSSASRRTCRLRSRSPRCGHRSPTAAASPGSSSPPSTATTTRSSTRPPPRCSPGSTASRSSGVACTCSASRRAARWRCSSPPRARALRVGRRTSPRSCTTASCPATPCSPRATPRIPLLTTIGDARRRHPPRQDRALHAVARRALRRRAAHLPAPALDRRGRARRRRRLPRPRLTRTAHRGLRRRRTRQTERMERFRLGGVPGVTPGEVDARVARAVPDVPIDLVDRRRGGCAGRAAGRRADAMLVRLPLSPAPRPRSLHVVRALRRAAGRGLGEGAPDRRVRPVTARRPRRASRCSTRPADARAAAGDRRDGRRPRDRADVGRESARRPIDAAAASSPTCESTTIALAWLQSADSPLHQELIGIARGRKLGSSRGADREHRVEPGSRRRAEAAVVEAEAAAATQPAASPWRSRQVWPSRSGPAPVGAGRDP